VTRWSGRGLTWGISCPPESNDTS